jgi:3-deoxy-manno-octulosonate cytidylyltransferase (CMP-KDO synthetase)
MFAYNSLEENADIVVNIQGDEPLLHGSIIDSLLSDFLHTQFDVGTVISPINSNEDLINSSIVKVDINSDKTAKIFSRKPVPEFHQIPKSNWLNHQTYFKHIGIYAYKIEALKKFVSLPVSEWEMKEQLEQLRLLEAGAKFYCHLTNANLIGVDTPEDLIRVRDYFSKEIDLNS